MRARLITCSLDYKAESPIWSFKIELLNKDRAAVETLPARSIFFIADKDNDGALYELCRAIRDAKEWHYDALIGVEFGAD